MRIPFHLYTYNFICSLWDRLNSRSKSCLNFTSCSAVTSISDFVASANSISLFPTFMSLMLARNERGQSTDLCRTFTAIHMPALFFYCLIGFHSFLSAISNVWTSRAFNSFLPTRTLSSFLSCQEPHFEKIKIIPAHICSTLKQEEKPNKAAQMEQHLITESYVRFGYQKKKIYSKKRRLL